MSRRIKSYKKLAKELEELLCRHIRDEESAAMATGVLANALIGIHLHMTKSKAEALDVLSEQVNRVVNGEMI